MQSSMQHNSKFDTMLTRTYQARYEPSGCEINPYFLITEHKLRPRLEEIHKRNMYRRSLSQVLNSKANDPVMDKTHATLNTLHKFEKNMKGKVSVAAPTKDHQQLAAMRLQRSINEITRDQVIGELNIIDKENMGYNAGRHTGKRPATAVLARRPHNAFYTYEHEPMNQAQLKVFDGKMLHRKIMNDRVQTNNLTKFQPAHLRTKPNPDVRSQSQEHKAINDQLLKEAFDQDAGLKVMKAVPCSNGRFFCRETPTQEDIDAKAALPQVINVVADGEEVAAEVVAEEQEQNVESADATGPVGHDRQAAEVLEVMRNSNIKDIIRGMTVHEQLKLLRNFLEDEEFKRREAMREERESRDSRQEKAEARSALRVINKKSKKVREQPEVRNKRLGFEDMTYSEAVNEQPHEAIDRQDEKSEALELTQQNLSAMNEEQHPRRIKFNMDLDLTKVNGNDDMSKSSKKSSGWSRPSQMDEREIQRRQQGQNQALAKKIVSIVKMNNMAPPVPRLEMGC